MSEGAMDQFIAKYGGALIWLMLGVGPIALGVFYTDIYAGAGLFALSAWASSYIWAAVSLFAIGFWWQDRKQTEGKNA